MTTLLLVGHGSRDPRSARELRGLAERVRAAVVPDGLRPGGTPHVGSAAVTPQHPGGGDGAWAATAPDVRLAFLELSEPVLEDVLAHVSGEVVVVPLLLGAAFHARLDLPGRLDAMREQRTNLSIVQADVLGPDPRLDAAAAHRGRELMAAGCDGVVLAGTGSSRQQANDDVMAAGRRVATRLGAPVEVAFVAGSAAALAPLDEAVARLREQGCERIGFVPWFLAPGLLLDAGLQRAQEMGVTDHAGTLAGDPTLVDLVLARAAAAASSAAELLDLVPAGR